MFQYFLSQAHGDDGSVIEEDNVTSYDEGMTVFMVLFDLLIPVSNVLWGTIGDGVVEQPVGW